MTLIEAASLTSYFLAFALLIQAVEFISLSRRADFFTIWSYQNLKTDLENGLPFSKGFIAKLFSDFSFKIIVWIYFIVAFFVFILPAYSFLLFLILFFIHLYICIRFRGTFNGGSDMMSFVLLTGMLIYTSSTDTSVQKLGLIYIAVHAVYSYFKAGRVKVISPEWRNGKALPLFLEQSLYADTRQISAWLKFKPKFSLLLCWSVILFEMGIVTLPLLGQFKIYYFIAAILFHFVIYKGFGLNRFFWVWVSAWPAILYSMSLI